MRVSILIPSYSRPEKLKRAIAAALAQDYEDIEVIVKLKTPPNVQVKVIADTGAPFIADPRLKIIACQDESIAQALNQAAEYATGDIFHFACDDDEMLPDACSSAVSSIASGAEWTYGVIHVVSYASGEREILTYIGGWPWDGSRLQIGGNYIPQPTVFWTRKAWDFCGPFDESLPLVFDMEMWGRFGALFEPAVRQHVDSYYEQHDGSISVARQDEQRKEVETIQKRWYELGFGRRL